MDISLVVCSRMSTVLEITRYYCLTPLSGSQVARDFVLGPGDSLTVVVGRFHRTGKYTDTLVVTVDLHDLNKHR